MTTNTLTHRERIATVLRASAEAGTPIIINVMTCCRSCAQTADAQAAYDIQAKQFDLPALKITEQNATWAFGGQGNELAFRDDGTALRIEEMSCECEDEEDEYEEDEEGNEVLVREGEFHECRSCRGEKPKGTPWTREMFFGWTNGEATSKAAEIMRAAGFKVEFDPTDHRTALVAQF